MKTLCFSSGQIFLVKLRLHLWGNHFSTVLCSSSLGFLRSSSLFSFLHGYIRRELWEYVFLRCCAFFVTCFLLMELWRIKDCFKDLRVLHFLKARYVFLGNQVPSKLISISTYLLPIDVVCPYPHPVFSYTISSPHLTTLLGSWNWGKMV